MNIITPCPHCFDEVIIIENEINCGIFRHAVYKDSLQPINPHASKQECERLIEEDKVYGCAKPFKLEKIKDGEIDRFIAIICDYI